MYRNFMVKDVKSEHGFNRIVNILKNNHMHYFVNDEHTVIKVNVGSTRKSTKRYDVCKKLGFKFLEEEA